MDWRNYALVLLALLPLVKCWSPIKPVTASQTGRQKKQNAVSPYIDILMCPIQTQPWSCAREQSGRILDIWDNELHTQWQKLKVEADRQLKSTLEKRGYSATEIPTREKPSTILKKIEIGTDFMKQYLAESMDGFLGHEFDVVHNDKTQPKQADEADDDDDDEENDADTENDEESPAADGDDEDDDDEEHTNDNDDDANDDDEQQENANDQKSANNAQVEIVTNKPLTNANTFLAPNLNSYNSNAAFDADKTVAMIDGSSGDEFFEIHDVNHEQEQQPLDKKVKGTKRRKMKQKGQKGQHLAQQPATLVVVQQAEPQHDAHPLKPSESYGHGHKKGGKRKKRKQRPGHSDSVSTVIVEEAPSNHLGFELLEELVGEQQLLSGGGKRKHKNKISSNYGRSNGVQRGKKKKKRKAIAKLILLGTFLKAKIELLLKILGAHLQIKFFAIALIGLLINIARFWIDVKRGGVPQKVVYVEHAHHQHHYEDHGDDWSESGGGGAGGYWKRSLQTDEPTVTASHETSYTDSYQPLPPEQVDAHYMAYRNQWH